MYQLATHNNVEELLSYFEKDLMHCLYSYIDLKKYGIDNEDLQIYYTKENNQITCVATKYYNGLQLYHFGSDFPVEDTIILIQQLAPTIVSSTLDVIHALSSHFKGLYEVEEGYVTSLSCITNKATTSIIEQADLNDMEEIAALICMDEGLGGHYTIQQLKDQLTTRRKENFGRNYIIRQNKAIICHAATYAEVDNLAVISGVITHPSYRGKGLALNLVTTLCEDLLIEGKQPHLFFYTKDSERLYKKIGFDSSSGWGKLVKIKSI